MTSLGAEARKLLRPLTTWLLGSVVIFSLFQLLVHEINGQQQLAGLAAVRDGAVPVPAEDPDEPPPCEVFGLAPGAACERARGEFLSGRREARRLAEEARALHVRYVERAVLVREPLGAAVLGVGMWASIPGAVAVGLLAAGHVAGEWSGRTVGIALAQDGRRVKFLAVKALSVWTGAGVLMLLTAALLAVAGPLVALTTPLDAGDVAAGNVPAELPTQFGRALLVLAVFAAVGTFAAVLTRGPLGAVVLHLGVVITALATVRPAGPFSPGTWVSAWMGYPERPLLPRLWVEPAVGGAPGPSTALVGLVVLAAGALAIAALRFRRVDVVG